MERYFRIWRINGKLSHWEVDNGLHFGRKGSTDGDDNGPDRPTVCRSCPQKDFKNSFTSKTLSIRFINHSNSLLLHTMMTTPYQVKFSNSSKLKVASSNLGIYSFFLSLSRYIRKQSEFERFQRCWNSNFENQNWKWSWFT